MRRRRWIEIHNQPWFPNSLRDLVTNALQFVWKLQLSIIKEHTAHRRSAEKTPPARLRRDIDVDRWRNGKAEPHPLGSLELLERAIERTFEARFVSERILVMNYA